MCATASTACFLTFFFFGSAKFMSSLMYSVGLKTKNCSHRPISTNIFLSIRDTKCNISIALHSPVNSRHEVHYFDRAPLTYYFATRSAIFRSRSTHLLIRDTKCNISIAFHLPLDWPPWSFPGARVRTCALAAQGKTASVANSAITAEIH